MGVLKEVALNLHVSTSDKDMPLANLTICEHTMSSHLIKSSLVLEMFFAVLIPKYHFHLKDFIK